MSSKLYIIRQLIFLTYLVFEITVLKVLFGLYLPKSLFMQILYIFAICLIIPNISNLIVLHNNKNITYLRDLFSKFKNKILRRA